MPRFCIQKLHANSPAQADVPGQRITVNLPEAAAHLETWADVLQWARDNPEVPFTIHRTILAVRSTFTRLPNRQ